MTETPNSTALVKAEDARRARAGFWKRRWHSIVGTPEKRRADELRKEIRMGVWEKNARKVRDALARGASPNEWALEWKPYKGKFVESSNITLLLQAAGNDDVTTLRAFADKKVDLDAEVGATTALVYAAAHGSTDAVVFLVLEGARVDFGHFKAATLARLNDHHKTADFLDAVRTATREGTKAVVNGYTIVGQHRDVRHLVAAQMAIDMIANEHSYAEKLPPEIQAKIDGLLVGASPAMSRVQIRRNDTGEKTEEMDFSRRIYDADTLEETRKPLPVPKMLSFERMHGQAAALPQAVANDRGRMHDFDFYGAEANIRMIFNAQARIFALTEPYIYDERYKENLPEEVRQDVEAVVFEAAAAVNAVRIYGAENARVKNPFMRLVFNGEAGVRKPELKPIDCEDMLDGTAQAEALVPAAAITMRALLGAVDDSDAVAAARALRQRH